MRFREAVKRYPDWRVVKLSRRRGHLGFLRDEGYVIRQGPRPAYLYWYWRWGMGTMAPARHEEPYPVEEVAPDYFGEPMGASAFSDPDVAMGLVLTEYEARLCKQAQRALLREEP